MNKLFIIFTIFCLVFLCFPLNMLAQNDIDITNLLLEAETSEPEINLNSLELFWWADTYTPFGYSGRPLPTKGSLITVNADLKISGANPGDLKYSWFLDGIFQESKSGYGKDAFKFGVRRTNGASHSVLVKIFNENRSFYIEKSISIPVVNPEVVVYHKNNAPLNLSYLSSEKSFDVISDKESSFLALPYFFSVKSLKDLEFEWSLGKKSIKESSFTANIFGLKIINKETGGMLEETLKVFVTNKFSPTQKVSKNIKISIY